MLRAPYPDVIKLVLYRPSFFGWKYARAVHIVRVADAMNAQVSSTDYAGRVARSLRHFGYFL